MCATKGGRTLPERNYSMQIKRITQSLTHQNSLGAARQSGSDQVTLSNVKPPYFPSGGLEYLVLRCTDSNGAFDGAYQVPKVRNTCTSQPPVKLLAAALKALIRIP